MQHSRTENVAPDDRLEQVLGVGGRTPFITRVRVCIQLNLLIILSPCRMQGSEINPTEPTELKESTLDSPCSCYPLAEMKGVVATGWMTRVGSVLL